MSRDNDQGSGRWSGLRRKRLQRRTDRLMSHCDWAGARRLFAEALVENPSDHWLLLQIGHTHYEQRQYLKALSCQEKAAALAPRCPSVQFDMALCLEMLGRDSEALALYRRLSARDSQKMSNGACGESLATCRGLISDSMFSMAKIYARQGEKRKARRSIEKHLKLREAGAHSIYQRSQVQDLAGRLESEPR